MSARTRISEPDEKRGKPSKRTAFSGEIRGQGKRKSDGEFPAVYPDGPKNIERGGFGSCIRQGGGGGTFCQDRSKKLNDGGLSRRGREPRHSEGSGRGCRQHGHAGGGPGLGPRRIWDAN